MINEEKLENLMSEARIISAADNVLYPLIDLKIQQRIDLACARFVGGDKEFISDIAYIQGLKEVKLYLKRIQTAGNQANYELNKDQIK